MEVLWSTVIGLGLRFVLSGISEVRSILVGVWEGVCLHRLTSNSPGSPDPYLAYALRLAFDVVYNPTLLSVLITVLWSVLSLLALAAGKHGHDTRRELRLQRGRSSRRVHQEPPVQQTHPEARPHVLMPALFSPRSPNAPPSPPSCFLDGETSDSMVSPVQRIVGHLPTPPETLSFDGSNDMPQIIALLPPQNATNAVIPMPTTDDNDSTPSPSVHRLSTVLEEEEDIPPSTVAEFRNELPAVAEKEEETHSDDEESFIMTLPTAEELSNSPLRQVFLRSDLLPDSHSHHTPPRPYRPSLILDRLPPLASVMDQSSTSQQPLSPQSDLDELQTPPHFTRPLQNFPSTLSDADPLQTPKHLDEELLDEADNDPLLTPARERRPLSPLPLKVPQPELELLSSSPEVVQAEALQQSLTSALKAEVSAFIAASRNSSPHDNNYTPVPVPPPPHTVSGEEEGLDVLSAGQITPTEVDSVISDAAAQVIEFKAAALREDAWAADRELERLRVALRTAEKQKKTKDAFLLKADIADLNEKIKRLHRSAEKRFFKGVSNIYRCHR